MTPKLKVQTDILYKLDDECTFVINVSSVNIKSLTPGQRYKGKLHRIVDGGYSVTLDDKLPGADIRHIYLDRLNILLGEITLDVMLTREELFTRIHDIIDTQVAKIKQHHNADLANCEATRQQLMQSHKLNCSV